jgi:hypothetical protein
VVVSRDSEGSSVLPHKVMLKRGCFGPRLPGRVGFGDDRK